MAETVRLSEAQRRFLSRRVCALCEIPLHRDICGAVYGRHLCTQAVRDKRRADCLATYKPRRGRSALSGKAPDDTPATSSARD